MFNLKNASFILRLWQYDGGVYYSLLKICSIFNRCTYPHIYSRNAYVYRMKEYYCSSKYKFHMILKMNIVGRKIDWYHFFLSLSRKFNSASFSVENWKAIQICFECIPLYSFSTKLHDKVLSQIFGINAINSIYQLIELCKKTICHTK